MWLPLVSVYILHGAEDGGVDPSEASRTAWIGAIAAFLLLALRWVDADDMALAMRHACDTAAQVIDPHTAIGLHAARAVELPHDVPVVTLATAHPAKFEAAVEQALAPLGVATDDAMPPVAAVEAMRVVTADVFGALRLECRGVPHSFYRLWWLRVAGLPAALALPVLLRSCRRTDDSYP